MNELSYAFFLAGFFYSIVISGQENNLMANYRNGNLRLLTGEKSFS